VDPRELRFPELGYARDARGSYSDFCEARARGDIAKGVRFQVCLPTPMGVIYAFCTRRDLLPICNAYEQAMVREIERVCRVIPHDDLCIQFDFCHELLMLDGQPQDDFPMVDASMDRIMQRMATLGAAVPPDVEMGVHLCYGDFGAKHILEPRDSGAMVGVMNAMSRAMPRSITYFHIPVPLTRDDDAYFAPLEALKLPSATALYVGLIHASDDVEGARRRMATADRHVPMNYGLATECGMARQRTPQLVTRLLELHAALVN
jgi:methionine synthase II (cobalamin-independent)